MEVVTDSEGNEMMLVTFNMPVGADAPKGLMSAWVSQDVDDDVLSTLERFVPKRYAQSPRPGPLVKARTPPQTTRTCLLICVGGDVLWATGPESTGETPPQKGGGGGMHASRVSRLRKIRRASKFCLSSALVSPLR